MILVTGAKGVVGLPLCQRLALEGRAYRAVSRQASSSSADLQWDLSQAPSRSVGQQLSQFTTLIHCAPIWLLPAHFDALYNAGISRLVVFSSTSVLSKQNTEDSSELHLVNLLRESEEALMSLCKSNSISLIILRPSLIYGYGRDQNVSHIASFIRRFGFMLLVGKANGLRQPVHADDLAELALNALSAEVSEPRAYNVAGKDAITYRQMVIRIFKGLGRRPFILSIPLWLFRPALIVAAKLSGFSYTAEMATRMNQDLNYDYSAAAQDFGFSPQGFLEQPQRDLTF
ncbi:MAG: nucleoside-diphosphate-sugar epimerase [Arenicella sp.]|jgi:nucleoside-diphosphate-sugar epimerase